MKNFKRPPKETQSDETNISQPQLPTLETPNRIISSNDFMQQFKNEVWLIKPIIPSTELGELFGASGSRKTFMALDIGTCVHNGLEWHGHEVTQGNVLYVCGEGINGVRKRLSAFKNHYGVEEVMKILPTTIDMMKEDSMQQLQKDIEDTGLDFTLIIIDTLNGNFSGSEDSADDFAVMKKNLQKYICKDTRMVSWVHHTGNQEGKRGRGTSARYAGVDVSIQVTKDEKYTTLSNTKQKDAEEFQPLTFSFKSVPTDFVEEDGAVLYSIVPIFEKGMVKKAEVKLPKFNEEICKGIRLAVKDNKAVLPTKKFEEMFNLRTGENRVVPISDARKYAYKMFDDDHKSQAFSRWLKIAQKIAHCYFYDDHIILANDAKQHTQKR